MNNDITKRADVYFKPNSLVQNYEIMVSIDLTGETIHEHFKEIYAVIEKENYSNYKIECIFFRETENLECLEGLEDED